jgi:hypothetical protein
MKEAPRSEIDEGGSRQDAGCGRGRNDRDARDPANPGTVGIGSPQDLNAPASRGKSKIGQNRAVSVVWTAFAGDISDSRARRSRISLEQSAEIGQDKPPPSPVPASERCL